jgi:hypothetical protein
MKKQLGILLFAFIVAVGFSGAAAAAPLQDNGHSGSWWINHHSDKNWRVVWRGDWRHSSWWRHHARGHNYRIIVVHRNHRTIVIVLNRIHRFRR